MVVYRGLNVIKALRSGRGGRADKVVSNDQTQLIAEDPGLKPAWEVKINYGCHE